ncbi:MAG TPA: hypothetical protein VK645_20755, partial [Chitinophagaceae bacterium]|nr:hypothetical protein [Chitinophagaceae bacterium]
FLIIATCLTTVWYKTSSVIAGSLGSSRRMKFTMFTILGGSALSAGTLFFLKVLKEHSTARLTRQQAVHFQASRHMVALQSAAKALLRK